MVLQALTYINEYPEFIDFVKDFDEEHGFMWSIDKRKIKIFNGINNDEHSPTSFDPTSFDPTSFDPTSFALTLRVCQNIYKGILTLEQYKESCGLVDEHNHTQKRIFH